MKSKPLNIMIISLLHVWGPQYKSLLSDQLP